MSGDETNIDPAMFTSAGGRVAEVLERAAVPVASPVAVAGPSPADAAAANLAALMDEHIGNASAELAPRGSNIREATQAAVAEIQAQDLRNAQQIKGISTSQAAIEQLERGLTGPGAAEGPKEPFSWEPTPSDLATGSAAGIAGAAHDYATGKASKLVGPDDPLLNWTRELKVKGAEIPGFTRAGGLLGVATAIPGGIIDYSEAKAAGASTIAAVGQAVAREGTGTAVGLAAGGLASGFAADLVAGAAIGSVVPGAGTAVGLVVGAVVGGASAFVASKGVGWLFSG